MATEIVFNFGTSDKPAAIRVAENPEEVHDRFDASAGAFALTALSGSRLSAGEAVMVFSANIIYMHGVS